MEDNKGYIWMTGNTGLLKYDATKFTNYRCDAQSSLSGSCIQQDKYNRIWYENFDGYLYYIENEILKPLKQKNVHDYILYGLLDNFLITVQKNGFDIYDLKTLEYKKTIFNKIEKNAYTAFNDKNFYLIENNKLWAMNSDLILKQFHYFDNNKEFLKQIYASDKFVFVVARNNESELLYVFDQDLNFIKTVPITGPKSINNISLINQKIWISSSSGAFSFDFNNPTSLPNVVLKNTNVSKVIKDRYNNYWISSTAKGITILPENTYSFYPLPTQENNRFIDNETGFYIATNKGMLYDYNINTQKINNLYQTDNQTEIYYLAKDKKLQNIFLSAYGFAKISTSNFDIHKYQFAVKKTVQIDEHTQALASSGLVAFYQPEKNKVNSSEILMNYIQSQSVQVNENITEIDGNIRAKTLAYSLADNAIYYSGNKGLFSFSTTDFIKKEIKFKGQSFFATEIAVGSRYKYLLNTKGNLYQMDNNASFKLINYLFKCNEKEISFFKECNGFSLIVADNKFFVLNLNSDSIRLIQLPVLTSEIKDVALKSNILYLLVNDGILKVDLFYNRKNQINYPFYISDFKVNNKSTNIKNDIELSYNENNISIHCAYLNYIFCSSQTIYYSINNQAWQVLNAKDKIIQFASLNAGNYQIKFKIDETIQNQVLNFKINRPFWLRWWFLALCVLVGVCIIILYNRWRTAIHDKQITLLEEKVILEQSLGKSILTSIKSQMNPHFFYNALNTIQAYIFTNDKKNASSYLAKFSKLTRMILEMSEKETISIQNEIEALKLYLELEKMRFEEDFNFVIEVQNSVDIDMIKIPSMLVQPYTENAVKHGLMHAKGEKQC